MAGKPRQDYWSAGLEVIEPHEVEIALSNGLDRTIVYKRITNSDWSKERAITEPRGSREPVKGGYTREDVLEAERNGISYKTFTSRVFPPNNWSIERAKTEKVRERK